MSSSSSSPPLSSPSSWVFAQSVHFLRGSSTRILVGRNQARLRGIPRPAPSTRKEGAKRCGPEAGECWGSIASTLARYCGSQRQFDRVSFHRHLHGLRGPAANATFVGTHHCSTVQTLGRLSHRWIPCAWKIFIFHAGSSNTYQSSKDH